MAWDTTKVPSDLIQSSEWNAMVTDQKTRIASGSSFAPAYAAVNSVVTLGASHRTVNCTANSFTVSLPTAVGISGREYYIKNSGTGTITVDANGSENIDGASTVTLAQYEAIGIVSNGANWIIISRM
jgi:hypothetical protein